MNLIIPSFSSIPYPPSFDCPMRELAIEYAQKIQPFLSVDQLQEIVDALNGSPESRNCNLTLNKLNLTNTKKHRNPAIWNDLKNINTNTSLIYVDYIHGNDNNNGSIKHPLKHLESAITLFRKIKPVNKTKNIIILRKGTHYLPNTIDITSLDNNLLITNHNNEYVELSGGIPLNCSGNWVKWNNTYNNKIGNYYKCIISSDINITNIPGLRVNGTRAIRARYPNGNPEVYPCGFCSNLKAKSWLKPTCNSSPITEIYGINETFRNDSENNLFQYYQLGIHNDTHCCDIFTPTAGYWCGNHVEGGGASAFTIPTGLTYDSSILPNTPYRNITDGVIHCWRPGHWASWMFQIDETDSTDGIIHFSKGGFQGGRGATNGDEFYIENIVEELDYPTEYFYNKTTRTLYYYHNETDTNKDPSDLLFESTNLKILLNFTNTKDHEIRGIVLKDTAYTYLDEHSIPSGGDWALQRSAALYLYNVTNINITTNLFSRLDGNTISITGYARDIVIERNEIVWNGDNVVSVYGNTEPYHFDDEDETISFGYDGYSKQNQPRNITFRQNFVHEIGVYEKQSSMWFQAKSCQNVLDSNIFFNSPRAGINFNDGFGGGTYLKNNLLFNTCRESGDHGPFNSWDRQVYVTTVRNGTESVIKAYDHIYNNFIIANYNSLTAIDNDDGSCYYDTHSNFFVYGAYDGLKNQWGGHDNHHYNNIYAYIGLSCFCIHYEMEGHIDWFYNNTCIINQNKLTHYGMDYGTFGGVTGQSYSNCDISTTSFPILGNNTIHILSNDTDYINTIGLCEMNEKQFQNKYNNDIGTQILGYPDNDAIIQQAKQLLWN